MQSSTRRLALVALILALTTLAAQGDKRDREGEPQPQGPELKLTATPRHGFRPLKLTLMAHLRGVDVRDQNFCHAGIAWESVTPSGLTDTSREDPRCLHPPEQVEAQLTFSRHLVVYRPGTYVHRVILHLKDGTALRSNTQEIRVLDNQ